MTQSSNEKLSFAIFIKVAKSLNKQLVLTALLSALRDMNLNTVQKKWLKIIPHFYGIPCKPHLIKSHHSSFVLSKHFVLIYQSEVDKGLEIKRKEVIVLWESKGFLTWPQQMKLTFKERGKSTSLLQHPIILTTRKGEKANAIAAVTLSVSFKNEAWNISVLGNYSPFLMHTLI